MSIFIEVLRKVLSCATADSTDVFFMFFPDLQVEITPEINPVENIINSFREFMFLPGESSANHSL